MYRFVVKREYADSVLLIAGGSSLESVYVCVTLIQKVC